MALIRWSVVDGLACVVSLLVWFVLLLLVFPFALALFTWRPPWCWMFALAAAADEDEEAASNMLCWDCIDWHKDWLSAAPFASDEVEVV